MDRIIVRPITANYTPSLAVLPFKISVGKLREKSLDEYVEKYDFERHDRAVKYIEGALRRWPSAAEHIVLTFLVEGCSRVCTHQLVRHRIASYTQESLRYSLPATGGEARMVRGLGEHLLYEHGASPRIVIETARKYFVFPEGLGGEAAQYTYARTLLIALAEYLGEYEACVRGGGDPRLCMDMYRYMLPQAIRTRILVTMNLREIHHFLSLRCSREAHPEIRRVARLVLENVVRPVLAHVPGALSEACPDSYDGGESMT